MVYICNLSPEIQKIAKEELNEDPERRQDDIDHIREWLKKQPHINARTDDNSILLFLRGCKFSLQRTKEKLEMFYTCRGLVPEWFTNWDPLDPKTKEILELGMILPLRKYDDLGRRVIISRSALHDPALISIGDVLRTMSMISEVMLNDDMQLTVTGMVQMFDFKGITGAHVLQNTPSIMKKFIIISQEGSPIRLKGFHHLNMPSFVLSVFEFARTMMKDKMIKRFHFHRDMESLYKHIPKDILPIEYGGTDGSLKELTDYWTNKVIENRDWLREADKFTVDESKRLGKAKTSSDIFGIEGSFRKLNVD